MKATLISVVMATALMGAATAEAQPAATVKEKPSKEIRAHAYCLAEKADELNETYSDDKALADAITKACLEKGRAVVASEMEKAKTTKPYTTYDDETKAFFLVKLQKELEKYFLATSDYEMGVVTQYRKGRK